MKIYFFAISKIVLNLKIIVSIWKIVKETLYASISDFIPNVTFA